MSLICEILGQFSIENKVIWDCFDFSLLFSVIGLENHRFTFLTNQLQNTIYHKTTWWPAFSRALGSLVVFT